MYSSQDSSGVSLCKAMGNQISLKQQIFKRKTQIQKGDSSTRASFAVAYHSKQVLMVNTWPSNH
jgi:hypothetical protein